jgi:hypothetical protein
MAKHERDCLVCGRKYVFYDAAPKHFCSVACEADAGGSGRCPSLGWQMHKIVGRTRPAKTVKVPLTPNEK